MCAKLPPRLRPCACSVLSQFGDLDKESMDGTLMLPLREYARLMRDSAHPPPAAFDSAASGRASLPTAARLLLSLSAATDSALQKHFSGLGVFSLGADGQGVLMHSHAAAWLLTLHGTKSWRLLPPEFPFGQLSHAEQRSLFFGRSRDWERPFRTRLASLASRHGGYECHNPPGHLLVIPDRWWHATENHGEVVAVGGRREGTGFERDAAAALADPGVWRARGTRARGCVFPTAT